MRYLRCTVSAIVCGALVFAFQESARAAKPASSNRSPLKAHSVATEQARDSILAQDSSSAQAPTSSLLQARNEYAKASDLFTLKKYADAARHCRASLQLEQADFNTWKLLIRSLRAGKQKDAVRNALDEFTRVKPKLNLIELVRFLAEEHDLEDVRYLVSRAVPSQRTSPERALVVRGVILDAAGQESEAISYFEKAMATKPTMTAARYQLALVRFRRGEVAEAIRQMRIISNLNPDSQKYALNLSVMLAHVGDFTESEALARRCLAREPESAVCIAQLGRVLVKQKKLKEAEKYLRNPILVNSDDFATLTTLAAAEDSMKNYSQSEKLWTRAAAIHDDPRVWTELGICKLNQGKKDGIDWLRKAVSKGDGSRAWRALGYAYKKNGDEKAAQDAFRKAAASKNTVDLRDSGYLDLERMNYRSGAMQEKRNPDSGILVPSFSKSSQSGTSRAGGKQR